MPTTSRVLPLVLLATGATGSAFVVPTLRPFSAPDEAHAAAPPRTSGQRLVVPVPPGEPAPAPAESAPAATARLAPREPIPAADARMWRTEDHERAGWYGGEAVFLREWDAESGLGAPHFNAASCADCHRDPVVGGSGPLESNVLTSTRNGYYEGSLFLDVRASFEKAKARHGEKDPERIARDFTELQPPTLLGLGLIAAIPDQEILRREDPDDLDGDGIRGRARRVRVRSLEELGRFGWKASVPRIEDFVRRALGGEHGLTVEGTERGFSLEHDRDGAADPEVTGGDLQALIQFVSHLAPPSGSSSPMAQSAYGRVLFDSVGCSLCHTPELYLEDGTPVPLFSDLLIHDVATETYLEGLRFRKLGSTPVGFRTPPLWGVGDTAPYLCDGTAPDLDTAIRRHGGEAEAVRETYEALLEADREVLLEFLSEL